MNNKSKMTIDKYGTKRWYLNNKLHRIDGSAVEYTNGDKFWFFNGKYHRTNGPAIECKNGYKTWYLNGIEVTKKEVMIDINPDITEKEYLEFVINL